MGMVFIGILASLAMLLAFVPNKDAYERG